jgi:hypothetical protein
MIDGEVLRRIRGKIADHITSQTKPSIRFLVSANTWTQVRDKVVYEVEDQVRIHLRSHDLTDDYRPVIECIRAQIKEAV